MRAFALVAVVSLMLSGCAATMRCNRNAAIYSDETTVTVPGRFEMHYKVEWRCTPLQPAK